MQRETETRQRDENDKDRGGPHRAADEETYQRKCVNTEYNQV